MGIAPATVQELLHESTKHQCPDGTPVCVQVCAIADLPTRFGEYQVAAFYSPNDRKEHAAFVHGDVVGREEIPVRLHSECLTGDAIGSLRCDCRDQLIESLERIGKMEAGIVLYLRQEGRGIGFVNKIKAYQLQDSGFDTVEANERLGFRADERDYAIAAHMLWSLRVRSIRIMTNNPAKMKDLEEHGVQIVGRIPVVVPPNDHDLAYMRTKQAKMGHLLGLEQEDDWRVDPETTAK